MESEKMKQILHFFAALLITSIVACTHQPKKEIKVDEFQATGLDTISNPSDSITNYLASQIVVTDTTAISTKAWIVSPVRIGAFEAYGSKDKKFNQ